MKIRDCNEHQKAAWRLANECYCDIVGGLENTLLDNAPDSKEYINAKNDLNNPEVLLSMIYILTQQKATQMGFAKHIRFAGEGWIKERISRRLSKDGYYPNFIKNAQYD